MTVTEYIITLLSSLPESEWWGVVPTLAHGWNDIRGNKLSPDIVESMSKSLMGAFHGYQAEAAEYGLPSLHQQFINGN